MAQTRLRIALVGGGSFVWSLNLVRDLLLTPELADRCDFVLLDLFPARARLVKAVCDKLVSELGVRARITATHRRTAALDSADYVLITISTGGLGAMYHDIAIPERFGIFHTVGDTCGPGGWARAIRNFSTFVDLARAINRHAPHAMVLNYTNPMACLTDVLARLCKGPVIGLCHGLFENLEFIKRVYRLQSEDQITAAYAGVNHFFWMTRCHAGEVDAIADLRRRAARGDLSELLREICNDPMGFHSDRRFATELLRQTGVLPYLGDRHTCEFLPGYITNRARMRNYNLARTSVAERRAARNRARRNLQSMLKLDRLPAQYHKRSRETAADIIQAHSSGRAFIDVGNVPNVGQVANLPRGLVVETAVRVDRSGFTALAFGDLPPGVIELVEPFGHVFRRTVDACLAGDVETAFSALRADPVCSHLSYPEVRDMGQRLLGVHRRYIRCF